jgi:cytohesin
VALSSSSSGPPLVGAVSSRQLGMVQQLLAAGASPDAQGDTLPTPNLLLLSLFNGDLAIAEALVKAGADTSPPVLADTKRTVLHLAAKLGASRLVQQLLKEGHIDVDVKDSQGTTPLILAVGAGSKEVVAQLLAAGADPNAMNDKQQAPLLVAAWKGYTQLVKMLVAAGARVDIAYKDSEMALHFAASAGHAATVAALLDLPDVDVNMCTASSQFTALHAAARSAQAKMVKQLIAAGADVNQAASSQQRYTALHWAVRKGDTPTIRALLAAGADVHARSNVGTPLHEAVLCGASPQVLRQLVNAGADIAACLTNTPDVTALHMAVQYGYPALVQLLLDLGANPSSDSVAWGAPLQLCVLGDETSHTLITLQLVAGGANLNAYSHSNDSRSVRFCTPLSVAVRNNLPAKVDLLLGVGADPSRGSPSGTTPLHSALLHMNSVLAERLLAASANVNAVHQTRGTPLAVTINLFMWDNMVDCLLVAGADPTLGSEEAPAALVTAMQPGSDFRLLERLLAAPAIQGFRAAAAAAAGATAATGSSTLPGQPAAAVAAYRGNTPEELVMSKCLEAALQIAAAADDEGVVVQLLQAGAPWDALPPQQKAAVLRVACACGHVALVQQLLLDPCVNCNAVDANGFTPLHYAVRSGSSSIVEGLLQRGAQAAATSNCGMTPLHSAANTGNLAVVQQLVQAGAIVTACDQWGCTPLSLADARQHQEVVCWLQGHGAAASSAAAGPASSSGNALEAPTAAAAAAAAGEAGLLAAVPAEDVGMASRQLQASAPPNGLDPQQQAAALFKAIASGDGPLVEELLQGGADPNTVSEEHGSPLSMAAAAGNWQIVKQLLRAAAAPDVPDSSGSSPLHLAVHSGEIRAAQLLLAAGANSNLWDNSGLAPLHLAVSAGSVLMVDVLARWPTVMIDVSSMAYDTPLLTAVKAASGPHVTADNLEVVDMLLQGGADPMLSSMALQPAAGNQAEAAVPAQQEPVAAAAEGEPAAVGAAETPAPVAAEQEPAAVAAEEEPAPPAAEEEPVPVAAEETLAAMAAEQEQGGVFSVVAEPEWRVAMRAWAPSSSRGGDDARSDCGSPSHSSYQAEEEEEIDDATRARWACPLQLALDSRAYPVAALLLRHMARQGLWDGPNACHSSGCGTLLHAAARDGDLAATELLLRSGAVVDAVRWSRREEGTTPLLLALEQVRLPVVERLLAAGADPNVHLGQQLTTLELAMLQGSADMAGLLLKWGANPNPGGGCNAGTPLQLALVQKQAALVEQLLAAGAVPDVVCEWNHTTPLQLAVAGGCPRSVQLLLGKGADTCVVEVGSGDTLLHVAVRHNSSSIVGALLGAGAAPNEVNRAGDTPLLLAVREGQEDAARQLLQGPGVDVRIVDSTDSNALHLAARSGRSSIVPGLLQRGAQVAATDSRGLTPLHHAAFMGHLAVVQQLVEAGADVWADAACGAGTPLHLALAAHHWEVAECLLASGLAAGVSAGGLSNVASVQAAGPSAAGSTALTGGSPAAPSSATTTSSSSRSTSMASCLHLAAEVGHMPTITTLLKAGADPCAVNSRGELPLHSASRAGHTLAVRQLIAAVQGTQPQLLCLLSTEGFAPVHLAAAGGHISVLAELLGPTGVGVNIKGAQGRMPLHLAAAGGHKACVWLLVKEKGANREALDADGATPLQLAFLAHQPQVVPLLGTSRNVERLVGGTTLLHTAVAGRKVELVAALLAAGASLTVVVAGKACAGADPASDAGGDADAAAATDSQGKCALEVVLQQGDPALFLAVVRHLMGRHPTATLPLRQEVVAAAQVYLGMKEAQPQLLMQAAMEVMGADAAIDLLKQVVHLSRNQQQQPPPPQQPQKQQQQQQAGQQEAPVASVVSLQPPPPLQQQQAAGSQPPQDGQQQPAAQSGPGLGDVLTMLQQHQQQQPPLRLGQSMVEVLLQCWQAARSDLAQQREVLVPYLLEAALGSSQQGTAPAADKAAAVGSEASGQNPWRHGWEGKLVHPTAIAAAVAAAAAPGAGKWQALQELLQQLPPAAHTYGVAIALRAAAEGGHKEVCGLLLQQLLSSKPRSEGMQIVQGIVTELEGTPYHVLALSAGSLTLCEWVLGAWQEVRQQQQQELVDAVVSAVGVMREAQQQVEVQRSQGRRGIRRRLA